MEDKISELYNSLHSEESRYSTSNLYKLNKDMLIKLLLTIREDSRKELLKEIESKELCVKFCDSCRKTYSMKYDWHFNKHRMPICLDCIKKRKEKNPQYEVYTYDEYLQFFLDRGNISIFNIMKDRKMFTEEIK